jgi:drug/metabolite transporter (DMT)-like permease
VCDDLRGAPAQAGLFAGIGAVALWCFTGVCFTSGSQLLGPMVYTTAISVVGFIAGSALHAAQRRPMSGLFRMQARVWAAGFAGISVYTVLLVLAVGIAPMRDVAQVVLVNYLWPLFIVALHKVMIHDHQRNGAALWSAAALGFAGVAIARGPAALARPPSQLLPHALALTGALLWALYSVLLRRWRVPDDQNGSTAQWLLCAALAATVGWARGEWAALREVALPAVGWVAFCGIGPVGVAYYWWEIGMKRGAARFIAVLSFFIPVGSALLMGLFFRQTLSVYLVTGAVLIATASWLGRDRECPV